MRPNTQQIKNFVELCKFSDPNKIIMLLNMQGNEYKNAVKEYLNIQGFSDEALAGKLAWG